MSLSGTQTTRIGVIGFPGRTYLGFTPKGEAKTVVVPGLEYSLEENKLQYSIPDNKLQFSVDD